MNILDYNNFVEAMHCQRSPMGGYRPNRGGGGVRPQDNKDQEKTLSTGFNTYAVTLPNGCKISMSENGEVHIAEKDAPAKKLRHKDNIQQHLVK